MPSKDRLRPLWAWSVLAATPLAVVVTGTTDGTVGGLLVATITVCLATVAAWVGASRNLVRPLYQWSLAGCGACFVLAETAQRLDRADAASLWWLPAIFTTTAYVAMTVFVLTIVRSAMPRAHRLLWTDAGLVAGGAGLVAWSYVLTPAMASGRGPEAAVEVVWLAWDALLMALVLQLALRPLARLIAFWLMLTGFTAILACDVVRAGIVAGWADVTEPTLDAWQLVGFGVLAAMCLHPSVAAMRATGEAADQHTGPVRLAASYLALLAPTLVVLGRDGDPTRLDQVQSWLYAVLVSVVFVRMVAASTHLARLQRVTRHRADHDDLTGLLNRATVLVELDRRATSAGRDGRPWHLLFVDLDHFKQINDTWSHAAGDAVLRQLAERLTAAAGPGAVVGRIGGDEFVIGTDEDPALAAARLQTACEKPFVQPNGDPLAVTCSVGVASTDHCERVDVDTLLADADVAMYAAKSAARGSVRWFSAADRDQVSTNERLRQDLDGAIDRGELAVHLQPLVQAAGGVVGYEALLRWSSPTHGILDPDVFVPVADAAGLMERIGAWVLQEACAHLRALRGTGDVYVSVNLTARQLADPLLPRVVAEALRTHRLPASALWLELTESSMVRDTVATIRNVAALRELGVTFALDDFGTGFASLAHLHDLACQVVKIDRSFVARLHEPRSGEAIVRSIVAMSHALDLTVVAEGVETTEQADRLTDLGVDVLQGFLFGRPSPVTAFVDGPAPHDEDLDPEPVPSA